jgi:hypothetical protein
MWLKPLRWTANDDQAPARMRILAVTCGSIGALKPFSIRCRILACEQLYTLQVHLRELVVAGAYRRVQQSQPERAILFPPRPKARSVFSHESVHIRCRKSGEGVADHWRHSEQEGSRTRHRSADTPRFHQYIARERCRAFGGEERTTSVCRGGNTTRESRMGPSLWAVKVQIQEQNRTTPGSLAGAGVDLSPKVLVKHSRTLASGRFIQRRFGEQSEASFVQPGRRRQHGQTGPPEEWQR